MQTNFAGKLEDKERADDDQNEDSASEEDLEKTCGGEQDENAIEIDERSWDPDRDQEQEGSTAPEPEEIKIGSGYSDGYFTIRGRKIRIVPLGQNHKQKRNLRKKKALMAQFMIMKKKIRKIGMMKQRKLSKKSRRMVVKVNQKCMKMIL